MYSKIGVFVRMSWLLLCVCVSVAAATELRCDSPACIPLPSYGSSSEFSVEGHKIEIAHYGYLFLRCEKWPALDSRDMPHFMNEIQVSEVFLSGCPPPRGRRSFVDALAALNVKFEPTKESEFKLFYYESQPVFNTHHFTGLEYMTNLTMKSFYSTTTIQTDLFSGLRNLHSLVLHGIIIDGKLKHLPQTLESLELFGTSVTLVPVTVPEIISEAITALPNLTTLKIHADDFNASTINTKNSELHISPEVPSLLESLILYQWKEQKLKPLAWCDNLRTFMVDRSNLEELPDRLVTACPHFEELVLIESNLRLLPEKLLEGATSLKRLSIKYSKLESLPGGLLKDTSSLIELNLSNNKLKILPTGFFLNTPLQILTLSFNSLTNDALQEIKSLTTLQELNLGRNPLQDPCNNSDLSPLQYLTQLKKLDLSSTHISKICRDWRENMIFLEYLNLDSVSSVTFIDFQYKRDPSVKTSIVRLNDKLQVKFTEEDYKNSLKAPSTGATVQSGKHFYLPFNFGYFPYTNCNRNCELYWVRKAMDNPNQSVKLDLSCKRGGKLKNRAPKELCPDMTAKLQ